MMSTPYTHCKHINRLYSSHPSPPLWIDDLDYIIDMYQDFKVSYDTDQISVVSTGSKPDSHKSVFSWLKGTKKVKSSDHTHFKR